MSGINSYYNWNYLCNDPRRLAITLRGLPKEPFKGLLQMNICWASHLDSPDTPAAFQLVARTFAPKWLQFTTFDMSQLRTYLPEQLALYWKNDKARWALGMKLLMPYVEPDTAYLYTDDDVLITSDPQDWMTNSFGSKGCFRFAGCKQGIARELFRSFELAEGSAGAIGGQGLEFCDEPPAWKQYDNAALDAGVWFQKYPDDWSRQLYRFANMSYLADLGLRNLEFRCLDQRFLTCFGIKHGWDVRTIGNGFAPVSKITPRLLARRPFFHYKSSSKTAWMALFEEYFNAA